MRCLIVIPHVFQPKIGSLYSSQDERKRGSKKISLMEATIENLNRHNNMHWIHASLGRGKEIVTRRVNTTGGIDLRIQVYTDKSASLTSTLPKNDKLEIIHVDVNDNMKIPQFASQKLLEQSEDYEMLGYMEDDMLIEDPEFFLKIRYLHKSLPKEYTVIPHRCEHIPNMGDVILSGDPDGGRTDLFWDTKEKIRLKWSTGDIDLYRAVNPHSGCFFLSREQAITLLKKWQSTNWESNFQLSGPLEHAASGRLITTLKVLKPVPESYRFLMIKHRDDLWKRHKFEEKK